MDISQSVARTQRTSFSKAHWIEGIRVRVPAPNLSLLATTWSPPPRDSPVAGDEAGYSAVRTPFELKR